MHRTSSQRSATAGLVAAVVLLALVAPFAGGGVRAAEMISNASFESTGSTWLAPWFLAVKSGGGGSVTQSSSAYAGSHSAAVTVTAASSGSPWLVQLSHPSLTVAAGTSYTVSFAAKASSGRNVNVVVQGSASPYPTVGSRTVWVGTSWSRSSFSFTPTSSVTGAALRFNLAAATGTVWIDAVSVWSGSSAAPAPSGTSAPTADPSATPAPAGGLDPSKGVALRTRVSPWRTNGAVDSDYADLAGAGSGWVRIHMPYTSSPDWLMDREISVARSRGIRVIATLGKAWPTKDLGSDADRAAFRGWVASMVSRYRYWVKDWEVLNEPNLHYEWAIDEYTSDDWAYRNSVLRYLTVLQDAYGAIKGADSGAVVHFAGLSEWTAERYLNVVVTTDAWRYFDVMGFHPYGSDPNRVVSRFVSIRNILAGRWEYRSKPIWVTEMGFNTSWTNKAGYVWSETTKADYLTRSFQGLRAAGASLPILWYTLHENDSSPGYGLEVKDPWTFSVRYLPAYWSFKSVHLY